MAGFSMTNPSPSPDPYEEERRRLLAQRKAKLVAEDERATERFEIVHSGTLPEPMSGLEDLDFSDNLTLPPGEETAVPKQLRFTSTPTTYALSDGLANRSCTRLGLNGTLNVLNRIFHTNYTLDTPFLRPHIQRAVDDTFDIGLAYAHFRPRWDTPELLSLVTEENRIKDEQLRSSALQEDTIVNPFLPPRRVWDLRANRVVPYWVMNSHLTAPNLCAVSHSWMSLDKRRDILTSINGRKWPVPIPTDASLERVRIELLNLGAQYAWLDVLCLRQYGGVEEHLRADEWKLDVPMIGRVYHAGRDRDIVCYFSGLGRPFTVEEGFLNDPRHWLNRAWTLQETKADWIVGGAMDVSPIAPEAYGDSPGDRFFELLDRLVHFTDRPTNVLLVLAAMRSRDSVNPVDKVAGLGYILRSPTLPIYKEKEEVEDAWTRLIEHMDEGFRGDMFFLYPARGDMACEWRPSWRQILHTELPKVTGAEVAERIVFRYLGNLPKELGNFKVYWYNGPTIEHCLIQGLSCLPRDSTQKRQGKLIIERQGKKYSFDVFARHDQPIPERSFSLVGGGGLEYWALGVTDGVESGLINQVVLKFRKLSVLRMSQGQERERLERLKLCVNCNVYLC